MTAVADGPERGVRPAQDGTAAVSSSAVPTVFRFSARAMASPLRLTVHDGGQGLPMVLATRAWAAACDEFERSEESMSRFRETSGITRLNRAAGLGLPVPVDRRLRAALVAAWRAQRQTGGRFDPRILADLDRLGYSGVAVAPTDMGSAAPTIGHDPGLTRMFAERRGEMDGERSVEMRGGGGEMRGTRGEAQGASWLTLDRTGPCAALEAPVDLGGIGKGLALRWARSRVEGVLASTGRPVPFLLEAGGDLVARGEAPDGGPWRVGVEDPRGGDAPIAVVGVSNAAVSTSSVAVNSWRDASGRAVHHLIDPRTGEPGGRGLLAVTVMGRDPAWSEVWSKALFLEGGFAIGPSARSHGLAAWWVTESGDLAMTPAARPLTIWTA